MQEELESLLYSRSLFPLISESFISSSPLKCLFLFIESSIVIWKRDPKNHEKNPVNPSSLWEGSVFSSILSSFTKERNLDGALSDVGEPSLWGLTISKDEDKICNNDGKCTIPLYEYLFFISGGPFAIYCFQSGYYQLFYGGSISPVGNTLKPINTSVSIWRRTLHCFNLSSLSLWPNHSDSAKGVRFGSFCVDATDFWSFPWTTLFHGPFLLGHPFTPRIM